jgi:phospholipid/cholesterol/gamma-HCH transport system substrate-binding protein
VVRPARVFALGAIALAIAIVAYVLLSGGSTYHLRVQLTNASQLVTGDQVKIGGVPVGTVQKIQLTPDGQAQVTISVDEGRFQPLHEGTRAYVRVSSLLAVANRYVALEPGPNNDAKLADQTIIPTTDTHPVVEIDAFQSALDADTRQALQWLIHGGAQAYGGTGAQLNKGIVALDPALSELQQTFTEVARDHTALDKFIVSGAGLVAAVASRKDDLQQGLANAATTAQAIADDRASLERLMAQAPGTLRHATGTLSRTTSTLTDLQPVAEEAGPVAPRLTRFLTALQPVLGRAGPVLGQVQGLLPSLRSALRRLPALKSAALPAFSATTDAVNASRPIVEGALPYLPDVILGMTNGFAGTAGGYYDANGDYARIGFVGGPYSLAGIGTLLSTPPLGYTRHNYSRCPGGATQIAPDGSNSFTPPSSIRCNPAQRP